MYRYFCSVAQSCLTPCNPMDFSTPPEASLSFIIPQSLVKLMSVESMMPSNHSSSVTPFSFCPQSFPGSGSFSVSQLFASGGQIIRASASAISPSNEYSERSSFRPDWLNLLAVQETLKSLLQHHSSKTSILQCSAFFIVQLSHPYMTTEKTLALTRWIFDGKIMSLLFTMLSRLVDGHEFE